MAEISSVESWILRLQESDRIFYQKINEIRAQMGMPPAKPPSYDNKKQDPEPVIVHPEASGSRLQSMEENLKRMKALVLQSQQIADSIRSNSSRSFNYEREQEIRDYEHSDKDKEINAIIEANPANSGTDSRLGDNLEEQDGIPELPSHGPEVTEPISFSSKISEMLSSKMELSPAKPEGAELLQKSIFSDQEEIEDSVTKADGDRQILHVSSMEDLCPSKTADDLSKIDATIDTSVHEIVPGRFVQVEKQSLLNAHHMFDEMPKGKVEVFQHSKVIFVPLVVSKIGCVDSGRVYDDIGDVFAHSIDLIRSRADDGEPNSTDSSGLFVFDPGKIIRFLLHSGVIEALVIFVFDPGISCKV